MNCFQKSYLWLLNTTIYENCSPSFRLWIAFKNLIFDYWTQRHQEERILSYSCELLSKILSLTIEHNLLPKYRLAHSVVNCFQKSYLWLLNTTDTLIAFQWSLLWIAFKNLIFDYWTQPKLRRQRTRASCELLSKILSLTIEHNRADLWQVLNPVVNCFQKSYLWLLNTTDQHTNGIHPRCELLSKILSLTIEHNTPKGKRK